MIRRRTTSIDSEDGGYRPASPFETTTSSMGEQQFGFIMGGGIVSARPSVRMIRSISTVGTMNLPGNEGNNGGNGGGGLMSGLNSVRNSMRNTRSERSLSNARDSLLQPTSSSNPNAGSSSTQGLLNARHSKVSSRASSRRNTKIDAAAIINDVSKANRMMEIGKKKVPVNRKEIFKFECGGEILADIPDKGKIVKWKATFDRNLEELIYPSLQRESELLAAAANPPPPHQPIAQVLKKQEQLSLLHPHEGSSVSTAAGTSSHYQSPVHPSSHTAHHSEHDNGEYLFLYTPKWTMQLIDKEQLLHQPQRHRGMSQTSHDDQQLSTGSPSSPNAAGILHSHNGNNSVVASTTQKSVAFSRSESQGSVDLSLEDEGGYSPVTKKSDGGVSAMSDKDSVASNGSRKSIGNNTDNNHKKSKKKNKPKNKKKDDYDEEAAALLAQELLMKQMQEQHQRSILEEIDIDGEKYLRKKVVDRYEQRVHQEKLILKLREEVSGFFNISLPSSSQKQKMFFGQQQITTMDDDGGDYLYAALRKHADRKNVNNHQPALTIHSPAVRSRNRSLSSAGDDEEDIEHRQHEHIAKTLSDFTPEQNIVKQQTKIFKELVSKHRRDPIDEQSVGGHHGFVDFDHDDDEDDELYKGLLHYRVQGELHQAHYEEMQQLELKKMTMTNKVMSRRFSNAFSRRLSERKASSSSKLSGFDASKNSILQPNDHAEFVKADLIKTLPDIHELHLQRLNRAQQNQQNILNVVSIKDNQSNRERYQPPKYVKKQSNNVMSGSPPSSAESEKETEERGESSNQIPARPNSPSKIRQKSLLSSINDLEHGTLSSARRQQSMLTSHSEHELNVSGREDQFIRKMDHLGDEKQMAETKKRMAQDALLFSQLEAGVLPEQFLKSHTDSMKITIDLSNYGIGDIRGLCLAKCISNLEYLDSLGLSKNRLTSHSIPSLINNIHVESLCHLDLSFNSLHDQGAKAIAGYFGKNKNILRLLDLSNCALTCTDLKVICNNLKVFPNFLEELYLSGNQIASEGALELCSYLSSRTCVLSILDLSWNSIGEAGAAAFARALQPPPGSKYANITARQLMKENADCKGKRECNESLLKLNLAANSLNDRGGQLLLHAVQFHMAMEDLDLSQNSLKDGSCFVLAQIVPEHPTLGKLDISLNPLGNAGARSVFRKILQGIRCFVRMRNCSYNEDDPNIFNYAYPSILNPFICDLSLPYDRAIVQELATKVMLDPVHCSYSDVVYRKDPKAVEEYWTLSPGVSSSIKTERTIYCTSKNGGSNKPWEIPYEGTLKFNFNQAVFVPDLDHKIDDKGLAIMQMIVIKGQTEQDKRMWLYLICQDVYFTTKQAQDMIELFKKERTIGVDGLSVFDVIKSIWKYLLDTENMFDFLCLNLDAVQRKDLMYALTLKRFKFNWLNPTSYWRLNLADKNERAVMMQLIAINLSEAEFSQYHSGREDTSQSGNWYNFRNEKYTVNRQTKEFTIDKDFMKNLPAVGTIEFDFVSTTRPNPADFEPVPNYPNQIGISGTNSGTNSHPTSAVPVNSSTMIDHDFLATTAGIHSVVATTATTLSEDESSMKTTNIIGSNNTRFPPLPTLPTTTATTSGSGPNTKRPNSHNASNSNSRPSTSLHKGASTNTKKRLLRLMDDDNLYVFMQQLGLSNRAKTNASQTMYALMDLQLASTKYYFFAKHVVILLDCFEDRWDTQSKVVITMFSRIKDLHNMDIILRNLSSKAQQDVIRRLGCLNVINPLKPAFDYIFPLKYSDNRVLMVALMELAAVHENADQIIEDANTEVPISTLYGSYNRALTEVRPETMRFAYADFGVRTKSVTWSYRKEMLKKCLIGSQPMDEDVYSVITMYKELEAANALTTGPIDQQYANYQKAKKTNIQRLVKNNKNMINVMRNTTNNTNLSGGTNTGSANNTSSSNANNSKK